MKASLWSKFNLVILIIMLVMTVTSCGMPAAEVPAAEAPTAEAPAASGEEVTYVTALPGVLRLPLGTQQVNGNNLFSAIGLPTLCTAPDRGQSLSSLTWSLVESGNREFYPDGYELTSEYVNEYEQRFRLVIGGPTQEPVDAYVSAKAGVKVCLEAAQSPQPPPDISIQETSAVDIWGTLVENNYDLNIATNVVVDKIIAAYEKEETLTPEQISPAFGDTLPAKDIKTALDNGDRNVLVGWFAPLLEKLIDTAPEEDPLIISMEWLDSSPDPVQKGEYWAVHYLFDPPLPITIKKQVQQFKAKCQTSAWVQIEARAGAVWDWFWIANAGPQWAYASATYYPTGVYSTGYSCLYKSFYPNVRVLDTSVQGMEYSNTFYIKGGWTIGADAPGCHH